MALIKKIVKEEMRPVTIKLETGLAARLAEYSEYLNRSRDEIIALTLDHVIRGDKDFVSTRISNEATEPRKRSRKAS